MIKGAGDIASGIALRLFRARFQVIMTEIATPTAVRRTVSFAPAVTQGRAAVEGVEALLAHTFAQARAIAANGNIAVCVDPDARCVDELKPDAVVDAILAKRNINTRITDAPVVIGVGPGFYAGVDCHAVIETQRGHTLGRAFYTGGALPNSGVPGNIGGYTTERLLRAPKDGLFMPCAQIGAHVQAGEIVAYVDGQPVRCQIEGVLRGLLQEGVITHAGMKCGDVDPRCKREHCASISDKALAVGSGVLEALLHYFPGNTTSQ